MAPTQKALNLMPQIEHALKQLETVFYTKKFEPKTAVRTFVLGMSDYAEFVILPKLYTNLKHEAPHVSLRILSFCDFTPEEFERGELELGIGLQKKLPKQLNYEHLFTDGTLCAANPKNPIFKNPLTLKRYLQAEHVAVRVYPQELSRIDVPLKKLNLVRNIQLTLPDVLPAFQTIASSELIGTFSRNMVLASAKTYKLKYFEPPVAIPDTQVAQIWHRQQQNDSGLIWLRMMIKKVCQKYFH